MKKLFAAGLALALLCNPFFEKQAQATVSVQTPQNTYAADGSTTVWAYTFKVFLSTDIAVYSTTALGVKTLVTSNYTVNTNANTVTYPSVVSGLSPIAAGITITITRASLLSQTLALTNQGQFDAGNIEMAFDKLVMIDQEQAIAIAAGVPGPQGATGATGATGPPNSLSIGTVTQGSAAASITGSAPTQTLNLVLQKGDTGATGATGATGPAGSGSGDVLGPATNTDLFIPQWNGANSKTLKNGFQSDTDGTLAANSDTRLATQKATKTYADTKAAKGANSDITSLTALSTPLSVAQGGTGLATATIHGVVLGQTTGAFHVTAAGTATQVLTSNGASADPTFQAAIAGSGTLLSTHIFTSSGTWTKPGSCTQVVVRVVGGGGGGGGTGTGAGGGGGGYAERLVTNAAGLGATETVTIGAGGSGGSAGNNGIDGGASSFGTWATGGLGFGGLTTTSGGAGGVGSSGDINGGGGGGSCASIVVGGTGGSSAFGGGGIGGVSATGGNGTGYGGGGGGRSGGSGAGGNGANGIVVVYEYS